MKPVSKLTLTLCLLTTLAAVVVADQQSQVVLGKINFATLFDAAPPMPSSPAEAAQRTYGVGATVNEDEAALNTLFEPYNRRVAAARGVIQPAIDARPARQEAMARQATADAESNPIIAGMGGIDKMSKMSDEEREQAAAQAAGNYQQSMSGAPPQAGGGMQAIMQRMMTDPAYRERFEKMSQAEQEAEMRKAMGPGAPVAQHSSAEDKRAMRLSNEATAVKAKLDELTAIHQRILEIDIEYTRRAQAIAAAPGGHDQIAADIAAKIKKIPLVEAGEAGAMYEPVRFKAAQREHVTLDRARAAWELQQQASLQVKRKTDYKAVAASYSDWLKNNVGPASGSAAKLMQQGTIDVAVRCEEQLIEAADNLGRSSHQATLKAAQYELAYQKKMNEK